MLHKSNLWSEYLSEHTPLASSESRCDGSMLPVYASESGSGYGENHTEEASLAYVMKKEFVRRHWEQDKHSYDKEFVRFVDGKLQELDREKQNSSKAQR